MSLALALAAVTPLGIGMSFARHPSGLGTEGFSAAGNTPRASAHATTLSLALAPHPLTAQTTVLDFSPPPIAARAAILIDLTTGKVLLEKNADARLPMASTTKITTAAVVLHHARLSEMVKVSNNAATIGESTMELRKGERLSVLDLLYGMLLNSGNDAAVALAEHVGGSEAGFVDMMNELAQSLHMTNTHYGTPHGLDAPGHYTSARDLATITMYAMRDPTFRQIVATTDFHILATKHNVEHYLGNINKALYWYPGVDGVKPGDTDNAGLCQVVTATRNGHRVLAVLLHTPNLATDLRNLLNFGTRDFTWVPSIFAPDTPSSTVSGTDGAVPWTYFYGAGHYVRGAYLRYFNTHGGLASLGYPRTESFDQGGQQVEYFQGAELIYDPVSQTVSPEPLGLDLADRYARKYLANAPVASELASAYKRLGGKEVLGVPVTKAYPAGGGTVQFFRNGELASSGGQANLVPLGDAALRMHGWLPGTGIGDSFPPNMLSAAEIW